MSSRPQNKAQSAVVIAPLRPDQIDEAMELFRVQLEEHRIEIQTAALRRVIEKVVTDDRHGFILAAMTGDGMLVGAVFGAAFLGLEHGGESGWLEELYVLPEWRQNSVGTRLVSEAIRIARARGWRALDLEVDAGHQRVISLYQRHGFQPQDRSRYCLKLD